MSTASAAPSTTPTPTPSAVEETAETTSSAAPTTTTTTTTVLAPTTEVTDPVVGETTTAPTASPRTVPPEPSASAQLETNAPATTTPEPTPSAATAPAANGKKIPYTGKPTENPNETIVPGKMRSDREEIPGGYTKEQADKAEMKEARTQKQERTARGGLLGVPPPGCENYWPTDWNVCGAIRDKYNALGGPLSFLLLPTSHELVNPDGFGRRSHFANGPIYWSAATGAHPVVNVFHQKWGEKGWEGGFLGYPKTDEVVLNGGRLQDFQGATIYWTVLTGAHPVGGAIRDRWAQTGWEGGWLGWPTEDELVVGHNGEGRMNRFQNGVIYWSPATGAHSVRGDILTQWALAGYEKSTYGYPTNEGIGDGTGWFTQ
ncbi:LGFP repeat-containing protein [Rhodococcus kronopolitis]|uniref:LGFP repeat-containing protein n=1 Tax=Rhodococcus kronopolitis TaxID=1460226 RepID=A0ABV9FR80_9NOCA